jgi:hypothetical protein
MNFDLKSIIAAIMPLAPTLAMMLGGPLAGTAVTALESAFGLTAGVGPAAITEVMQNGAMTPDIVAKVREADQKHAEIIAQQGLDLQKFNLAHEESLVKVDADDRSSARDMAVKSGDSWTPRLLALLIVGGWTAIQFFLLSHVIDAGMRELVARVLGTLDSALMCVLYFYFGGSASSNRKTELLAQAPAVPK